MVLSTCVNLGITTGCPTTENTEYPLAHEEGYCSESVEIGLHKLACLCVCVCVCLKNRRYSPFGLLSYERRLNL